MAAFSDPTNGLKQVITDVTKQKCDCAKAMCNGNGRCHGVDVGGYAACQCFEGYSGANCTFPTESISLALLLSRSLLCSLSLYLSLYLFL
jgi:hypothetical protein